MIAMNKISGVLDIITPVLTSNRIIFGRGFRGALGYKALFSNLAISNLFPDWDTSDIIFRDLTPKINIAYDDLIVSQNMKCISAGQFNFEVLVTDEYLKDACFLLSDKVHIGRSSRKGYGECLVEIQSIVPVEALTGSFRLKTPAVIETDTQKPNLILNRRVNDRASEIYIRTISDEVVDVNNAFGYGKYISLGFGELC